MHVHLDYTVLEIHGCPKNEWTTPAVIGNKTKQRGGEGRQ